MTSKETPMFAWDTYQIAKAEAEFLVEERPEDYPDEDAAFHAVCGNSDLYEHEWEYLIDWIREWLEEHEYEVFYVEADNLGWRNLSGQCLFSIDPGDASTFIHKVIGIDADCTFKFFEGRNGAILQGTVWHHDSPMGEARRVYLAAACDHCGDLMGQEAGTTTPNGIFCEDCAEDEIEYAEATAANEEAIT